MTADLFSLAEGRRLRDAGMELAVKPLDASSWLSWARNMAFQMAHANGEVSADDVLKRCPRPSDVSPNATGSLFKDKRFKLVGYKTSTKTSAHARRIGVYQLSGEN